jgi:hypothetical protein
MQQERAPRTNSHVARLNRFLPFTPAHDQIYEEFQTGEDGLDLSTVALKYAERALREGARCIVLTGDAGHGKTHMCRRLIEQVLGYQGEDARRILVTRCDGAAPIEPMAGSAGPRLRIHKDLSELEPEGAALLFEAMAARHDEALVVCANEGRLRAILNSRASGIVCDHIRKIFRESFSTGKSSPDGRIHIINLNFQSVAARVEGEQGSLVQRAIRSWASDGRRWSERGCGTCSNAEICPIRRNRALLAGEDEVSRRRVDTLEELCRIVERLGHVITIREMLMLVAYLISGGLTCGNVHERAAGLHRTGWQPARAFYNLLFEVPPDEPEDRILRGIPLLELFRRLDPGAIASRSVDERILNIGGIFPDDEIDLQFLVGGQGRARIVDAAQGIDDFIGNPQNRAELQRETEVTARAVRSLRRKAFFDDNQTGGTLMSRLGFRHGDSFLAMLERRLEPTGVIRLKNMIIAGLHALQGLRMSTTETTLYLVDPAFGRASDDAAIIARRVPTANLSLLPARDAWSSAGGGRLLTDSVDWIDRSVVLRVKEAADRHVDLPLDLLSFECVTRSAAGYVSESFYAHEIRRIRSFLGRLAEEGRIDGSGEISLFMQGRVQTVSIDMGVIQVGGS